MANVVATEAEKILKELRTRRRHGTRKTRNTRAMERWQQARTKLASARAFTTSAGGESRMGRGMRPRKHYGGVGGQMSKIRLSGSGKRSRGQTRRHHHEKESPPHRRRLSEQGYSQQRRNQQPLRTDHRAHSTPPYASSASKRACATCLGGLSLAARPRFVLFGGASPESPSLIIPNVYLGDRHDASNKRRLKNLGVSRILNCAYQYVFIDATHGACTIYIYMLLHRILQVVYIALPYITHGVFVVDAGSPITTARSLCTATFQSTTTKMHRSKFTSQRRWTS